MTTEASMATAASDAETTTATTTTTQPEPPETPATLADAITAAERGIRDTRLTPEEIERFGRLQQRAYRSLAQTPEWDEQVRALLPADVLPGFDANVAARRAVAAHAALRPPPPPPPTLPAWTVVAPLPIEELLGYYREAEAATGVPWAYLAAINLVESRMGRIAGASSAGAVGPMQFLPQTWESCCKGDPLDPHDAIMGAATYLVSKGAPADMAAALYGYNPNQGYVGAVTAYAQNMLADERAYDGYHAWEVYYGTSVGTVRLPIGYTQTTPIDAAAYIAGHPGDLAPVSD
jgi:membrane-bound lytic murein transglycosylase B